MNSGEDKRPVVLIRGAGEMASGIAYLVHRNSYNVCLTEITRPLTVSRENSFSDAVFDGTKTVCDVTAVRVDADIDEIKNTWENGFVPLVIDPDASVKNIVAPDIVVDAIMAKRPTGTTINDARLVIGVGPGFYAGKDVHIVVETCDSSGNPGTLIFEGEAEADTAIPIDVGGYKSERVIWSPEDGVFTPAMRMGDRVNSGDILGYVNDTPLKAGIGGTLRGFVREGTVIKKGTKLIEIDPVYEQDVYGLIRDKIWTVGLGVVEAIKCSR
ncbi:MAG: EF2563 family selenium-dependent molybdenum hydroxylase system protein [Desulfatiglans sp.]|nr:EF2563 family selenium-dependent molybdenum hydroxylase system protein [Desulfatiglans sp.]